MAIGNWLRKAGDMADNASAAAVKAYGDAKEKATEMVSSSDDAAQAFENAVDLIGDAVADSGQMNSTLMNILQDVRESNPYK